FTTLTANPLFSQQNSSILEDAIRYRGLTPEDITIPINFSDTTATNNSRLLLPIVERLMKNPLQYDGRVDSVGNLDYNYNGYSFKLLDDLANYPFVGGSANQITPYLLDPTVDALIKSFILDYLRKLHNEFIKKSFTK